MNGEEFLKRKKFEKCLTDKIIKIIEIGRKRVKLYSQKTFCGMKGLSVMYGGRFIPTCNYESKVDKNT